MTVPQFIPSKVTVAPFEEKQDIENDEFQRKTVLPTLTYDKKNYRLPTVDAIYQHVDGHFE
jgi:hypothetical protein